MEVDKKKQGRVRKQLSRKVEEIELKKNGCN
jgi:hypothetical protein